MTTTSSVPLAELLEQASWAHRLARSLVRDGDEADDLVQETWIAALRRPPNAEGSLRPWLGTVLRRQRGRRALADRRRELREEVASANPDDAPSPETLLGRMEVQKLLAGLVTGLEEPYRQTILLRYYEGLTSAEIAGRLKTPAATVRWRLKVGLDRLRAALDAQTVGGRDRWLLMLGPLAPRGADNVADAAAAGRGLSRAGRLAVALVVVGAVPLVARMAWRRTVVGDAAGVGSGQGMVYGGDGRSGSGWSGQRGGAPDQALAAVAGGAPGCQTLVRRLRDQVVAAETEAMAVMRGPKLFARGAVNPAAEKELAAPLARIMALGGRAPSYTLECRTWVCKMTVAKTPEEVARTNEWQLPLQHDPEMSARVNRRGFEGGGQVKDPVSGVIITTQDVYLTLKDPSGSAMAAGVPMVPKPSVAFGPIPGDVTGCNREAESLRRRLATAQADLEADMFPETRFARAEPNQSLTDETTALVRRVFGTDSGAPTVECRGQVCKVTGPQPSDSWRQRLEADAEFRQRREGGTCCKDIFYVMKTAEQLAAVQWLARMADAFMAGPAPGNCQKKDSSAEGMLNLDFELPATGQPNGEGVEGKLALKLGGPLFGAPVAKCIVDEFASTMQATAVPQPTAAARTSRRLRYPLASPR
jgi:RNA polymerase sigma-70 factor (ECF subfamily)